MHSHVAPRPLGGGVRAANRLMGCARLAKPVGSFVRRKYKGMLRAKRGRA